MEEKQDATGRLDGAKEDYGKGGEAVDSNSDSRPLLHGTDGIRGVVRRPADTDLAALKAVVEEREVNGRAFRTIGQAIGEELVALRAVGEAADGSRDDSTIARLAAAGGEVKVVIGWDRRPGNAMLVAGLSEGLHHAGVKVIHGGEVATPGLHDALLGNGADAGLMVTASHNPASDSGVKLFDADGRKSLPALEARLATRAWNLAESSENTPPDPELCRPSTLMAAMAGHRATLAKRVQLFAARLGIDFTGRDWSDVIAPSGLLLDSSGGASSEWFAAGLAKRGIDAREVADRERDINDGCGAGDFSPTSVWTYDDLLRHPSNKDDSHALLDALAELVAAADGAPDWQPGLLVGAALDGDGDRCLLIEARENGVGVVDGDRMGDDWLRALQVTRPEHDKGHDKPASNGLAEVILATTIETDLALPASLKRFSPEPKFIECAVGDRWVAEALAPAAEANSRLLVSSTMPEIIGCEDSGHLILPAPHPRLKDHWSLVGDGAASLLAMLCARAVLAESAAKSSASGKAVSMQPAEAPEPFIAGWKRRESVRGVDRDLWTGHNAVADEAEDIVSRRLDEAGDISEWQRGSLNGEKNLMLIRCRVDGVQFSAGIRNSGTEAKTTISLRAAPNFPDLAALITLIEELIDFLGRRLVA